MTLTQERLKELFYYNPQFGIFVRLTRAARRVHIGDIAGSENYGYLRIWIDGRHYAAHRLVFLYMTGSFPAHGVDHNKGIKNDNRWGELTAATHSENMKNKRKYSNNMSGIVGVTLHQKTKLWMAYIGRNGKRSGLGYFHSLFEACCARKSAENKHDFHINHGRIQ